MSIYDLTGLGWCKFFAASFDSPTLCELVPARVARAERERCLLFCERGEYPGVPAGRLRHTAEPMGGLPVAGDWVAARMPNSPSSLARIEATLPRRTLLTRLDPAGTGALQPLAANVDLVLLAAGLDHDFNPRRLERGAAMAREAGAEPVVVLTKADLRPETRRELSQVMQAVPGANALAVSSRTGHGIDELRALIAPGLTAVLIGSSGAGKSTLVNRLLGYERQQTLAVREADSRGRHATTRRELFALPGGGLLMDTPGLRAFGLTGDEDVAGLFADIEALAAGCRFRDCRHEAEPGCAVKAALANGELAAKRLAAFCKLRREAERMARRRDGAPDPEARRRAKDLSKRIKRFKREDAGR